MKATTATANTTVNRKKLLCNNWWKKETDEFPDLDGFIVNAPDHFNYLNYLYMSHTTASSTFRSRPWVTLCQQECTCINRTGTKFKPNPNISSGILRTFPSSIRFFESNPGNFRKLNTCIIYTFFAKIFLKQQVVKQFDCLAKTPSYMYYLYTF